MKIDVTHPKARRGVVTVMVLIVLLMMSALLAEFVRRAVTDRRQMRREHQHQQTIQLIAAGVQRAQKQQKKDSDYTGETWQLPAGTIHQTNTATVVITINDSTVTVVARYPANVDNPLQVSRTIRLTP